MAEADSGGLTIRSGRMLVEWWSVLVAATAGVLVMNWLLPPVRVDHLVHDALQRVAPPAPSPDILIVAIDNRSLAALGRWPWPRDRHAALVRRLAAAAPLAIGLDVLFPEPAADPDEDARLAAAVASAAMVALPVILEVPGADGRPSALIEPVPILAAAAAATGHVAVRPDRDGVVRGIDRLEDEAGRPYPHLAVQLARLASGQPPLAGDAVGADGGAVIASGRDLIRFTGRPGAYPTLSFVDVIEGRVPASLIEGRLVLVGATAAGMGDQFSTPMSGTRETMAGVELHAHYLDGLTTGRLVRAAPPVAWQLFSLLPLWLLMMSLRLLGPRINLWLGLGLAGGVLAVTTALFLWRGLWLPPASALVAIGLIYPLWGWRRLDVANRYMTAELAGLAAEPNPLPRATPELVGDPVERQILLMHEAIRDVRDLREFVGQSLDNLPDAALVTNLDGTILIANDAAGALFARRLGGGLQGRLLAEALAALDPEPRMPDPGAQRLLAAVRDGRADAAVGYETRLADGVSLEIRLGHFTDSQQRPLGWIVRLADVTALRATERQREDALRVLTHDMRSPQAALLAVLEAEQDKLPPELVNRLARYAHQTLDLADDYVNLARAESGRFRVERFDLGDALIDAADDLWPLARAKRIAIETHLPEDGAMISGDRALLTRAIANLIGNAVKYSPEDTRIEASLAVARGEALLCIADEGRGIAPEDMGQLFEPFRRLAAPEGSPVHADAPGAGLGLAFVRAVVERHGGRVTAESEVGRGSVFNVYLPLAA